MGEEVAQKSGERLYVVIETDLPKSADVNLVYGGQIVQTLSVGAGPRRSSVTIRPDRSGWLSIRAPGIATSAIYVIVDGKPVRSAEDACYLVKYVDHLVGLVENDFPRESDRTGSLAAYAEARQVFATRFREAGGVECK